MIWILRICFIIAILSCIIAGTARKNPKTELAKEIVKEMRVTDFVIALLFLVLLVITFM